MSLFSELKRRNVIRVGVTYAVVGWVIAQIADLVLENFGTPDWVMKTLLFLIFIGFIVSLFIAWAYELTPEGIKRAEDVEPGQSITRQTAHKLDRLFIVVLLIAVGTLLTDRYLRDDQEPGSISPGNIQAPSITVDGKLNPTPESKPEAINEQPSVAVLPFVNMSSDPEQEYFSDGISEEILNVLTRIPNLKVAARTSSFQFKGKNLDIADIGRQLQVNHLLEGSVRKSGNTLRITAQLVETDTGFHLWSESFDRNPEDVFAIQDEIAAAIAAELRTLFSGKFENSSKPVDMRAYELYLKGRSLIAQRKPAELFEGIEDLKAAIGIEPDYAPALATLAKAYVVLPWFSSQIPAGDARETARQKATQSLEIDPENVEAMAVLGLVQFVKDLNISSALGLLEKAVSLNPGNVAANNFLGDIYTRIGNLEAALKYESRAAELDPLGTVNLTDLANVYLIKGDYDKAIELANRALSLDTKFLSAYQHLADANYFLGNTQELTRVYEKVQSLPGMMQSRVESMEVKWMLATGNRSGAESLFNGRVKRAEATELSASEVAFDAVLMGDHDTAGKMLLQAYRAKEGLWLYPLIVRLPEQAPDSEPWQEFWRQAGLKDLVELRRVNGLGEHAPEFGSGARP